MAEEDPQFKERVALEREKLDVERMESRRKSALSGSSAPISAFFGAGLLWLIFGSVFLGVFVKLSQSIPFALIIGLVFVAIMVWRGTR